MKDFKLQDEKEFKINKYYFYNEEQDEIEEKFDYVTCFYLSELVSYLYNKVKDKNKPAKNFLTQLTLEVAYRLKYEEDIIADEMEVDEHTMFLIETYILDSELEPEDF